MTISLLQAAAVAAALALAGPEAEPGAPPTEATALPAGATLEIPAASSVYGAKRTPPRRADPREAVLRSAGDVDASEALDEIIDEVAADVARLGAPRLAPILVERIRVSQNLDPMLAGIVEARLAAALLRGANAALVRCVECEATRAEVVDAAWVVSRGITRLEQARELARRQGARTLLRASLSAVEDPASLVLDVELVRAEDAAVVYAETYRFGGENAMLYRGADRAQLREERLKELENRLRERPIWSFAALLGYGVIEAKGLSGPAAGGYGAVRLDERFGPDRKHRISLLGGGFTNPHVAGGIFQIGVATRVSPPSVWSQTVELGVAGGGFVGGGAGNAPLFTATLDYRPAIRIGFRGTLGWLSRFRLGKRPGPIQLPDGMVVDVPDDRPTIGGLFAETGVTFSW